MVSEQGALFLDRKYTAEADKAFKIATEIAPSSPEVVFRYVSFLVDQNRTQDAIPVLEKALQGNLENQQFRDVLQELQKKATKQ